MWLNARSLSGPTQVNVSKGWSGTKCGPAKPSSAVGRRLSAKP